MYPPNDDTRLAVFAAASSGSAAYLRGGRRGLHKSDAFQLTQLSEGFQSQLTATAIKLI